MKCLHFSTYDIVGGAAKAAYRQHMALREAGYSSQMIVRYKDSKDKDVKKANPVFGLRDAYKKLRGKVPFLKDNLPKSPFMFNYDEEQGINMDFLYKDKPDSVDVIFLYWITNFLTVNAIKKIYEHYRCSIIWTLLDMEPFTGGCHYSFGCSNFKQKCENCHLLKSSSLKDWPRTVWRRKYKYLRDIPVTFIAPTSWIEGRIKESSLFRDKDIRSIPLAIDTGIFKPGDGNKARELLGVPQNKKIIFFGACTLKDSRKGMSYLKESLQYLESIGAKKGSFLNRENIFLLIAGSKDKDMLKLLPFPGKCLGLIKDDAVLTLAYQAADIFVSPSVEETGPMMIPEAMLCGTPVAAFNTGGAPDLIETMKTGYLARYKDSADLAKGIYAILTVDNLADIKTAAYDAALRRHSPSIITGRYLDLCKEIRI